MEREKVFTKVLALNFFVSPVHLNGTRTRTLVNLSGQKGGSITYSTDWENEVIEIFLNISLGSNRGGRFHFKQTSEFSRLSSEIQPTKLTSHGAWVRYVMKQLSLLPNTQLTDFNKHNKHLVPNEGGGRECFKILSYSLFNRPV